MAGLQQFIAFAETAKHCSFAAAARELGCASSTLAKAVSRLEASLGVKLFHRTTRQVALTSDGERLFYRCRRILAEVEDLQDEAAGSRATASGTLRVDMPITYGRRVLLPLLADLVRQHSQLALDIRLHDAHVDLVKEGVDVAIRIGALQDSTLVARPFAHQTLLLCASPEYLAERGCPNGLDQLQGHAAIIFRMPSTGRDRPWQFRQRGRPVEQHPESRLRISEGETMVALACLGQGLVQVPDYMVSDSLRDGRLVEVLPQCRPKEMPISAVYPGARLLPQRLRVFLDILTQLRDSAPVAHLASGSKSGPIPSPVRPPPR